MSFRDSNFCPPAAYGLLPPPPTPPSHWLPPTSPSHWMPPSSPSYGVLPTPPPFGLPPTPPSGYCDFAAHGTNQGHGNPGFGSGNDYFSQRIGHNYEYFGQNNDVLNKYNMEIKRHLEKGRIRDEIIAEEIAWRRVLESEVREELRREREMTLRLKGDIFHVPLGRSSQEEAREISLEERIARCVEEKLRIRGGFETAGVDTVPFKRMNSESRVNEDGKPKERVIFVAKPDANPSGTTKHVPSSSKEGLNKTVSGIGSTLEKKMWVCAICQVFTCTEYDLNEHLGGKKHKFNEAAVKADRKWTNIGLGVLPKDRLAGHVKSMEADLKGKMHWNIPPKKTQATQIWAVKGAKKC